MRTILGVFAALLLLHAPIVSAQSARASKIPPASGGDDDPGDGRARLRPLEGAWKSAIDRIALSTAFDESVWGKNAESVRTVELEVPAAGPATLTVTRKVVDARGRTVLGSTSIEQARLEIEGLVAADGGRTEYSVTVLLAERRYPDPPQGEWPLDGLKVRLAVVSDGAHPALEVRFDTPEGRGSFWETLRRPGADQGASR